MICNARYTKSYPYRYLHWAAVILQYNCDSYQLLASVEWQCGMAAYPWVLSCVGLLVGAATRLEVRAPVNSEPSVAFHLCSQLPPPCFRQHGREEGRLQRRVAMNVGTMLLERSRPFEEPGLHTHCRSPLRAALGNFCRVRLLLVFLTPMLPKPGWRKLRAQVRALHGISHR